MLEALFVTDFNKKVEGFSAKYFSFARLVLGFWLAYFLFLFNGDLNEVFLETGIYEGMRDNGLAPLIPIFHSKGAVSLFVSLYFVSTLFFAIGFLRKFSTVILVYLWFVLHMKSFAVPFPADGSIGFTLLTTLLIPSGEKYSVDYYIFKKPAWFMPVPVYQLLWFSFTVTLFFSGFNKLGAETWRTGEALSWILSYPVARDTWFVNFLNSTGPLFLKLLTYLVLAAEMFLPFLLFFKNGKQFFLIGFGSIVIGFALTLHVEGVVFGIFAIGLLLVNPKWFGEGNFGTLFKKWSSRRELNP